MMQSTGLSISAARMGIASMAAATPLVFSLEHGTAVRQALAPLAEDAGWRTGSFTAAGAFLCRPASIVPSCVILDISVPELRDLLLERRLDLPIVCIMEQRDVAMTVRAMKAGAVDVLTKPISAEALQDAVSYALQRSEAMQGEAREARQLQDRHASLSHRERQVMALVVAGRLNKLVGFELGISEITVKAHRGKVMRKMRASSFVDLVKMAAKLQLSPAGEPH